MSEDDVLFGYRLRLFALATEIGERRQTVQALHTRKPRYTCSGLAATG
jgi:hypothetical protein